MNLNDFSRRLLWHGLVVFLLGLSSGLLMVGPVEVFKNPRMALSSHTVGVTNGMFLIVAGLIWHRLRLSPQAQWVSFWMTLYGGYGNWGGSALAAIFGTGALSQVAGAGFSAEPWQETLVALLLSTSGTTTLIAVVIFLWGLRPGAGQRDP
jgi:hydroxylaminobenzene mutase